MSGRVSVPCCHAKTVANDPLKPWGIWGHAFNYDFVYLIDTCSRLSRTECVQCNCSAEGSTSSSCNSTGQCTCKDGYYGPQCNNRNCVMTNWSPWSNCACGHTHAKNRTRAVNKGSAGEGLPCFDTKENGTCTMTPCNCAEIRPGYYGNRCENRHCVLSDWSSWSTCAKCPRKNCNREACPTLHQRKHRTRNVNAEKVGSGRSCGARSDTSSCGYKCIRQCRRIVRDEFFCFYVQE